MGELNYRTNFYRTGNDILIYEDECQIKEESFSGHGFVYNKLGGHIVLSQKFENLNDLADIIENHIFSETGKKSHASIVKCVYDTKKEEPAKKSFIHIGIGKKGTAKVSPKKDTNLDKVPDHNIDQSKSNDDKKYNYIVLKDNDMVGVFSDEALAERYILERIDPESELLGNNNPVYKCIKTANLDNYYKNTLFSPNKMCYYTRFTESINGFTHTISLNKKLINIKTMAYDGPMFAYHGTLSDLGGTGFIVLDKEYDEDTIKEFIKNQASQKYMDRLKYN